MSSPQRRIGADEVLSRLAKISLPDVDAVVAIERGGLVPGELAACMLGVPMGRIRISYRNDDNSIARPQPKVIRPPEVPPGGRLLVVDDVSVTGATLRKATQTLSPRAATTLVMIGQADLVAFPEINSCVRWEWMAAE